jgi:signal peptidase II
MSRILHHTLLFAIAALVIVADQISKNYIRNTLALFESFAPIPALGDFFTIINTHNTGAAFGMFKDGGGIFTIIAIVVAAAIVFYYRQIPEGQVGIRLALGLQLGGAIGNLVDRLLFGTVTDFIFFHWYDLINAPIFNLADLAITSGVVVLALLMWRERQAEQATQQEIKIADS